MRINVLALSIAAMIGGLGFAGVASAVYAEYPHLPDIGLQRNKNRFLKAQLYRPLERSML